MTDHTMAKKEDKRQTNDSQNTTPEDLATRSSQQQKSGWK
jgi:hypothetical protein